MSKSPFAAEPALRLAFQAFPEASRHSFDADFDEDGSAHVQRLKTRPQFQAAMAGGTVARTAHFALHRLPFDVSSDASFAKAAESSAAQPSPLDLFGTPDVWMGALVPKRWAKHAVTRNAIKRQIYTVSDEVEARLPEAAHVVRLRLGFDRKTFTSATSVNLKDAVRSELNLLFERSFVRQVDPSVEQRVERSGTAKS